MDNCLIQGLRQWRGSFHWNNYCNQPPERCGFTFDNIQLSVLPELIANFFTGFQYWLNNAVGMDSKKAAAWRLQRSPSPTFPSCSVGVPRLTVSLSFKWIVFVENKLCWKDLHTQIWSQWFNETQGDSWWIQVVCKVWNQLVMPSLLYAMLQYS